MRRYRNKIHIQTDVDIKGVATTNTGNEGEWSGWPSREPRGLPYAKSEFTGK